MPVYSLQNVSMESFLNGYNVFLLLWDGEVIYEWALTFGDYICTIVAVFAGRECGAAESVVSVSKIRTKAKNQAC